MGEVGAKEMVPAIRFDGFHGQWVESQLGKLLEISSASRVHKEEWTKEGVPFFRTSDVVAQFKGTKNSKAFISSELYKKLSAKSGAVEKGDLLVTGGGSIGIAYLINSNDPLYFKDADLLWLKNRSGISGYYLYTFFVSQPFRKYVNSISHIGTISHYTIEQAKVTPINVSMPKEQTKIGEYFQELDTLIAGHRAKREKLLQLKKSLLEKMFPRQGQDKPEIRFKEFDGDWDAKPLGQMGETYSGLSGKTKKDFGHGKACFVSYMSVFKYPVAKNNLMESIGVDQKQNEVKSGDIFFTTSSETPEEVGMSSVWMHDIDNVYLNSFCFGYRPKQKMDNYFMAYLLRGGTFRKEITFLAQGISRYNISKIKAMSISINFPIIDEQTKIGQLFKHTDSLIDQHQNQITKLLNIKQACLAKMFV